MISERSCDTEDWSNDAEKSAFLTGINYILKYIQIENSYFKSVCKSGMAGKSAYSHNGKISSVLSAWSTYRSITM